MKKFVSLVLALVLCLSVLAVMPTVQAAGKSELEWQCLQFPGVITKTADNAGDVYSYTGPDGHLTNAWNSPQVELTSLLRELLTERGGEAMVAISVDLRASLDGVSSVTVHPLLRGENGTVHSLDTWNADYTAYCEEHGLTKAFVNSGGNLMVGIGSTVTVNSSWQTFTFTVTLSSLALAEEFLKTVRFCFDEIKTPTSIKALEMRNTTVQLAPSFPSALLSDEVPAYGTRDYGYESENLLPAAASSFDSAASVSQTGWRSGYGSVTLSLENNGGNKYLSFTKPGTDAASYYSASLNLLNYIEHPGSYWLSFDYAYETAGIANPFSSAIRTDREYSFSPARGSNYYFASGGFQSVQAGQWGHYSLHFYVSPDDIALAKAGSSHFWDFCLHVIDANVTKISFDNVTLTQTLYDEIEPSEQVTETKTWVPTELVFLSDNVHSDAYHNVMLDLLLTSGDVTLTVPCFWDGGNVFRARFALPKEGMWSYRTSTSTLDDGLDKEGVIHCAAYDGDLDVYKHGFVKTVPGTKHFVYADGTPFFYLGDTHWSLGEETVDMVKTIAAQRQKQGYTVIQSEPIGATFDCTNGIDDGDLLGFREFDDKFFAIADRGLTHANAEFFFPSYMASFLDRNGGFSSKSVGTNNGREYFELADKTKYELRLLSRYWVARYSAFPVMWTLGQEIDNDFYSTDQFNWCYLNNPYKLAAEYIHEYDPYKHPLTGHQENTGATVANNSAFRDVEAHTWYAAQWSGTYSGQVGINPAKDYWNNGQGKPTVDYEGKYCYLWTKNFGARVQGYMSYLNGMFGYGWGGQDTWSYLNGYNEGVDSSDGVDTVTSAEKIAATWESSLYYPSAYQVGYMRYFFEEVVGHWEDLIPRFDSTSYFVRDNGAYGFNASNAEMTDIVTYFYNFSDNTLAARPNSTSNWAKTGTLKGLKKNVPYKYLWFNPVTGAITGRGSFTTTDGSWSMPAKGTGDMVLYVYQDKTFKLTYEENVILTPGETLTLDVTEWFSGGTQRTVTVTDFVGFNASAAGKQAVTARWTDRGQSYTAPLTVTVGAKGDLNFDGSVDAQDLTLLARGVAKIDTLTETQNTVADVNGSGDVTADDLTRLARYVARIISEL